MAPKVFTGIRNQRPKSCFPVRIWKWSDHQKKPSICRLELTTFGSKKSEQWKLNVLPSYHCNILGYLKDLLILSLIMEFGTKIYIHSYDSKTMLFKILISCSIACKNIKVILPPKKNLVLLGLNLQPLDFKFI